MDPLSLFDEDEDASSSKKNEPQMMEFNVPEPVPQEPAPKKADASDDLLEFYPEEDEIEVPKSNKPSFNPFSGNSDKKSEPAKEKPKSKETPLKAKSFKKVDNSNPFQFPWQGEKTKKAPASCGWKKKSVSKRINRSNSSSPLSPLLTSLSPKALLSGNVAATTFLVFTAGRAIATWCGLIHQTERSNKHHDKETSDSSKSNRRHPEEEHDGYDHDEEEEEDYDDLDELEQDEGDGAGESGKHGGGWFGMGKSDKNGGRLPSSRVLYDQLEDLKRQFEQAKEEKAMMESEYEKASWQLQETMAELNSLKTTTRHLKAQLADNEDMMARAIRGEKRKAKEELLRMKEAMIKVVEREREHMREEFMKQASELQMLWKQKESANDPEPV